MKKRFLLSFLSAILIFTSLTFTGCGGPFDETYEKELRSAVYDIYEDLRVTYDDAESKNRVFSWLENWGENNDFFVNRSADDVLVMRKPASDGYENADSTTIQCPVSLSNKNQRCVENAIAMAVMKNSESHGPLTLIFTGRTGNRLDGVENVPNRYINRTDNLINLCYSGRSSLYTSGAATSEYRISDDLEVASPSATNAYEIKITGMESGNTGDRSFVNNNPIRILGNFLSGCSSRGMFLELASFESHASVGFYPRSATIRIAVSEGDNMSFLNRLETAIENFYDVNGENNENADFTYEAIDVPEQVFSAESTSTVIGLMYTLQEGVYAYENDDDSEPPMAIQNTYHISTSGGNLDIRILGRSLDALLLKEMNRSVRQTCDLNDVQYRLEETTPPWSREYNNLLADSMRIATSQAGMNLEPSHSFLETECGYFQSVSTKLDIVSLGVNMDDIYEFTYSLVSYLQSLAETPEGIESQNQEKFTNE